MSGRVTDGILYSKGQDAIARSREKMVKNQEQAVTGKSVNHPSDNPVAAMRVVGMKAQAERNDQVSQNLQLATAIMNMTDSSLGELSDILARAKELSIQMSSTSNQGENSRMAVANEVEQLMERAVQVGNTRVGDRYIFGGYQTDRAPFDVDGNYFGDNGVFEIEVDRGQKLSVNLPGLLPFLGMDKLPAEAQSIREQALRDNEPTLQSGIRGPASVKGSEKIEKKEDPKGAASDATLHKDIEEKSTGTNLFRVFKGFVDGLKEGNNSKIQESLDGLDAAFKQTVAARALIGARQNLINSSKDSIEGAKVNDAEMLSQTQDADSLKVFSDLAKNEHALTASLETSKRLLTTSLLDFLK